MRLTETLNFLQNYEMTSTYFSVYPKYNVTETSDLAQVSTSLCCIIK